MNEKPMLMLVDDDENLVRSLSDSLRFAGYRVIPARDGEEALQKLQNTAPDLIILDIGMPKMSGTHFLKVLGAKPAKERPPVLVLTARANMETFFGEVGVAGFLSKDGHQDRLLAEIQRILGAAGSKRPPAGSPAQPVKILLAEDDGETAAEIRRTLRRAGYDVQLVVRGTQVMEQALNWRPAVIVIKRVLSALNGDCVAALLKESPEARGIPVILYDVSAHQDKEIAYLTHRAGVTSFVPTSRPSDILQAVASALRVRSS